MTPLNDMLKRKCGVLRQYVLPYSFYVISQILKKDYKYEL